ncbi:DUF1876 domain-containing protein [Actinocrinis puniceicyclus]|uniref:DUF1876 domain-containing protein n=1 Tax=Actinocrinis puniceicyclus TaxID=977794 RepID=A0A8J8BGV4_9ACTN|nr:DUF1876 domain-containing protein [Actinocrinis puniceicyclus]MBS2966159.1 DUF1876 domain-containing protein [Actinocrinis puniceicyclus]
MQQTIAGWHSEVTFHEAGAKTRATALLRLPDGTELRAHGHASKHPNDPVQTRVGEELAAARALNDLARQLLARASEHIESATHSPAHPAL